MFAVKIRRLFSVMLLCAVVPLMSMEQSGASSSELATKLPDATDVSRCDISQDGSTFAYTDFKHQSTVRIWHRQSGNSSTDASPRNWFVAGISLSSDSGQVAKVYGYIPRAMVGITNLKTDTFSLLDQPFENPFDQNPPGIKEMSATSVAFNATAQKVAVGTAYTNDVVVAGVNNYSSDMELAGHTQYVGAVAWSDDDSQIASGSVDGTVRIWDVASKVCKKIIAMNLLGRSNANSVAWLKDGKHIVVGVSTWSNDSHQAVNKSHLGFDKHTNSMRRSSSDTTSAKVWNTQTGECEQEKEFNAPVVAVRPYQDDKSVIVVTTDGAIHQWDIQN